jgi:hypothetical protein
MYTNYEGISILGSTEKYNGEIVNKSAGWLTILKLMESSVGLEDICLSIVYIYMHIHEYIYG